MGDHTTNQRSPRAKSTLNKNRTLFSFVGSRSSLQLFTSSPALRSQAVFLPPPLWPSPTSTAPPALFQVPPFLPPVAARPSPSDRSSRRTSAAPARSSAARPRGTSDRPCPGCTHRQLRRRERTAASPRAWRFRRCLPVVFRARFHGCRGAAAPRCRKPTTCARRRTWLAFRSSPPASARTPAGAGWPHSRPSLPLQRDDDEQLLLDFPRPRPRQLHFLFHHQGRASAEARPPSLARAPDSPPPRRTRRPETSRRRRAVTWASWRTPSETRSTKRSATFPPPSRPQTRSRPGSARASAARPSAPRAPSRGSRGRSPGRSRTRVAPARGFSGPFSAPPRPRSRRRAGAPARWGRPPRSRCSRPQASRRR
mmetsp:Transcript_4374/g.10704  ORF Transcript_4374/g.10704 Transcript_4374/m.10704 type:complete len:368 (+) Transcript_4374:181-1284(+)